MHVSVYMHYWKLVCTSHFQQNRHWQDIVKPKDLKKKKPFLNIQLVFTS
jgi:hypothetical protein